LRQERYKYIRTLVEDEIEELYDLEADPQELHNLAVDPQHRARLTDYRRRLVSELQRTDAGLVENLPEPRVME
jgi:choline-sulfatase